MIFLVTLFLCGFFLNIIWEFLHWRLYTTALLMPSRQRYALLFKMSLHDGFNIVWAHGIAAILARTPLQSPSVLTFTLLSVILLLFAFFDERISVVRGRWEYDKSMPLVLGVGLSPLLELAVTGPMALLVTFQIIR